MAGIRISKQLKSRLPEDERKGLEEFLWKKGGGRCFLCEEKLNRATDIIEADHDEPDAEGGPTSRENLNLVHSRCNKVKRNNPSVNVRPYLKLHSYISGKSDPVKYDGCMSHFGISPKPSVVAAHAKTAKFEFPDGSAREVPVFEEKNDAAAFRYAFVDAPREAVFNDEDCQPRTIKLHQVWAIYSDIHLNPLHEPPSVRLGPSVKGKTRLLMFDGQHKTVACWMAGKDRVVVKVYLDIDVPRAVRLVNSIQAKIKKLPLSPFELAAKLSDEWQHKLEEYEGHAGSGASEKGFIDSLPPGERTRAKSAFQAALVNGVLDQDDFLFRGYVKGGSEADWSITEGQLTKKLLLPLLHVAPLDEPAGTSNDTRMRERENISNALNCLAELVFEVSPMSAQQQERARRLVYQSALSYVAEMIREAYAHILSVGSDRAMLEKAPTKPQWKKIQDSIKRLISHPIWTTDLKASQKTRDVEEALSKNQDAKRAFSQVGLKVGYVVGADKLGNDWAD